MWAVKSEYKTITTNGIVKYSGNLVMGAGTALDAKTRFPGIDAILGRFVQMYGNRCFILKPERLITFPTKHHYRDDSDIELIIKSCGQIMAIADKFNIELIAMTKPGCGNGHLEWPSVCPIIAPLLDDRFIVCV